jgi:hypothetical protein
MWTTRDLDDRVLAVAKECASAFGTSAGLETSTLALLGLGHTDAATGQDRFALAPVVPGHVLTSVMVADILDD